MAIQRFPIQMMCKKEGDAPDGPAQKLPPIEGTFKVADPLQRKSA